MSIATGVLTPPIESFSVLGVRVDAVQIDDVVRIMESWIEARSGSHYIAVTGMHGVSEARRDHSFRDVLNAAGLVVADGMPLVWLGRLRGHAMRRRVYGPELMQEFCRQTGSRYRHFLYGGGPGVAEQLATSLRERFADINIVGCYTPPFRALTDEELAGLQSSVRRAAPDVIWVGLSTPKQERWMHQYGPSLGVPALVGVGAAFDILSGRSRQAPRWMQEHGLEWLFRLLQEPRRLWRRYLVNGPIFVWAVTVEMVRSTFQRSRKTNGH